MEKSKSNDKEYHKLYYHKNKERKKFLRHDKLRNMRQYIHKEKNINLYVKKIGIDFTVSF